MGRALQRQPLEGGDVDPDLAAGQDNERGVPEHEAGGEGDRAAGDAEWGDQHDREHDVGEETGGYSEHGDALLARHQQYVPGWSGGRVDELAEREDHERGGARLEAGAEQIEIEVGEDH